MVMFDASETICIMCAKSCTSACSWSAELKPVEGWEAEENPRGFLVRKCPEFVKETAETILPSDIDKDGMMRLLEAVAKQMREDYIHGDGPYNNDREKQKGKSRAEIRDCNRKLIEKWLISGKGRSLLQLSNPEEVIKVLRVMARRHDTELAKWSR
jgi:hypothetical protein